MKLKTLTGIVILAIFSSQTYADKIQKTPLTNLPSPVLTQAEDMFWYNLINRNADYTGPVVFGVKNHISGFISPSLNYQTKRSSYADETQNNKGSTSIGFTNPGLYFDSQVNDWALAHVAVSYNNDFNNSANFGQMDMFFSEANATLQNFTQGGFLWSKIGRQYLNFGSDHSDLFTNPVTYDLYQTNAIAATVGVVNLHGFYGDVFGYNGVPHGANGPNSPQTQDSANNIHGYGVDLGYVYGDSTNGFNLVADYLADLNTTLLMQWNNSINGMSSGKITPTKAIPAYALNAYYHTGSWAFDASYVSAAESYDRSQWLFNTQGAQPMAYALEADYNFGNTHAQSVALGYQQTQDMLGMTAFGGGIPLPKTRLDFTYFYTIVTNMTLNFEIQNNRDYGTSDTMRANFAPSLGKAVKGTGNSYNYFGVGYKLIF